MRVLAFEDGADIALLLARGGVEMHGMDFIQHWDTEDYLARIQAFAPSILLLDHYIPPTRGIDLLRGLNEAVKEGVISRPETIVAMSSMAAANAKMLEDGADHGIIKSEVASLALWPRRHS
jgi:DNA-binding response OmpR family regulator